MRSHYSLALALLAVGLVLQTGRADTEEADIKIGPIQIFTDHRSSDARVSIGHDLVIGEDETNRDVVIVAGNATIDGTVRSLVVVLGSAKLGPTARVRHDAVVVGGKLEVHPEASIGGERVNVALDTYTGWFKWIQDWVTQGLFLARPFPHQFAWVWICAGAFLLLFVLVAVLLPRPVQACVDALQSRPISSFFLGILSLLLVGPLLLLLIISVVGAVALPFLFFGLVVAYLLGKVAVYRYAGEQLGSLTGLKALQAPLVALVLGTLLFYALYTVPVLGLVLYGLAAPLALGAVVAAMFGTFRSEPPSAVAVAPAATGLVSTGTGVSAAVPPEAGAGPDTLLLPRAGFWVRLGATVLDALLIGTLVGVVRLHEYPPVVWAFWLLYHFGMWAWKGTTIGGIVLGLKIVRLDGRPLNYGVVLVRCLSAFFSALVLFLGFFWVGWDREKQSWHDKIAGTVIVKAPKGTPLL